MALEITTNEALQRIVESLESIAESLEPIGDFFATVDVAIEEHGDTERASLATVLRAYRKAATELEAEADKDEPGQ